MKCNIKYFLFTILVFIPLILISNNLRVKVVDEGKQQAFIVQGNGSIDKQYGCVVPSSSELVVSLGNIDFSMEKYSSVMLECATSFSLASTAAIEVYAGSPLSGGTLLAKINPKKTGNKYHFRCFSSDILVKPEGTKEVFLKWKNNTSSLYAMTFETKENPTDYLLSDKPYPLPILTPDVAIDNFYLTNGYFDERFGKVYGDNDLSLDLGVVDFGDGKYNTLVLETSNSKTLIPDAVYEVYLDKEPEGSVQPESTITIDTKAFGHEVRPSMYGIFFEDINRAMDGGLYAEMIMNRGFQEKDLPSSCTYDAAQRTVFTPYKPVYSNPSISRSFPILWDINDKHPGWTVSSTAGKFTYDVVETKPLNDATPKSFYLDITNYESPVQLSNSGFWGIATKKGEKYNLYFYLCAEPNYIGNVEAQVLSATGATIASHTFSVINDGQWHKYECQLEADITRNNGTFSLNFLSEGTVRVDHVSLFPENTYMNRKNGLRADIAEYIADLKPAFIRWPGGCIVEGLTMENRVKWKNTIGLPEERKGEYNLWGYHSTNGMGYHEFLEFCEDLSADGVFVCNAGMSCDGRNGDYYTKSELEPLIQEAMDALEYALGDASTTWGAKRAANGHLEPFNLKYIEIGNENHGDIYAEYYHLFYDRIRAKYPDITIITCLPIHEQLNNIREFDMADPHFYNNPEWFYKNTDYFDKVERKGYEAYVGEFASNMGVGFGTMDAALSEAAFMIGMERNSDLVTMTSYAPLIENSNARSTNVNLIRVKNDAVMGRSSYYVQKIFSNNRPDINLKTDVNLGEIVKENNAVGYIGFATWDTSVKFSNVKVSIDGEVVYQSDFEKRPDEWEASKGNWSFSDGYMIQNSVTAKPAIILLKTKKFRSDKITVEFDALKTRGSEGFALIFGAKDDLNYYQMTLGSYGNTVTIFERIKDGQQITLATSEKHLAIYPNVPYKTQLNMEGTVWTCNLNGQGRLTYDNKAIQKQYVIAGLDRANNDVIIKVVNAEEETMKTSLVIENANTEAIGSLTTLSADNRDDENSFESPRKIYPETRMISVSNNKLQIEFEPLSLNIIRLKLKN